MIIRFSFFSSDFKMLPLQAVESSLHGVKPVDEGMGINLTSYRFKLIM